MNESVEGLAVIAIMRDEAQLWASGVEPGAIPESLHAPSEKVRHHHVREAQHHHGHDTDHRNSTFYESISASVGSAREILLVGHGKGRSNEMLNLVQYWERKHPDIAHRVVGQIESDLESLSSDQVLALVREWFEQHREFI
jgi:hypothetical protein